MRYGISDLPALLRTPLGRSQFSAGVFYRAWPLLWRLAWVNRMTFARRTRVVAVVGSTGKTTTARVAATALGHDPDSLRDNYLSHLAATLLTTGPRDRHAVMEVGIERQGEMARYARVLRPDVAVVTSIGSDHNRSLPSLAVTRAEKAAMVRSLKPSGLAVLNGDDENVRWMATQTTAAVRTFGFGRGNDVRATDVTLDWPRGTRFTLHANGSSRPVRTRLLGRHMVYTVLAGVSVALAEGWTLDGVLPAIEALPPTPGRLETVPLDDGSFLIRDDFKASLETIEAALDVLAEVPAARRIVVLGDVEEPPGSQGPIYAQIGARVAAVATRAVFVGTEFKRYATGARRAGMASEALLDAKGSVLGAAALVRADMRPGDVVLIKGRSTQRLDRIALALTGRRVGCELRFCDAMVSRCGDCPMLERGWGELRVVI